MPVNPNIALGLEPQKPLDIMGAYGNALTIKNLVRQGQMQDMQMQDYTANRDIDRAAKRVDLGARAAMLVYAAPEDQKQQVWSAERQRFIGTGLVSPNEIPEMYPGEQALQGWIAAAQSPEKRMELIEKDRRRRAQLSAVEAGRAAVAPKDLPQASVSGGAPGDLTAPTVQIRELVNPTTDPRFWDAIAERAMSDPDLIGTDVGQKAVERAAAIRSDTRKAEGEGLHYVQGPDGKMRVFQNGQFLRSEYLGTDPTKAFTVDESGKLVPNKQVQDYELSRAKAGASNVTAVGGDMALGKTAQGKVDEGLLDTSAALMRVERIGKEYRSEWSTYAKQGEMGFQAFREKLGGKLAPEKQKELAAYTSWRSSALDNMNRTIKDLTGSAMGVEEAARIMATLPNPDDSPSQFQRKLEDAKQQTRMALARLTYIKRNGLGMESVPLERVPSLINDRGAAVEQEIKKKFPSMTAKEVERMTKRQLAQEFGLIAD